MPTRKALTTNVGFEDDGFSVGTEWCFSKAFHDALISRNNPAGDVIYDTRAGYDDWDDPPWKFSRAIQVKESMNAGCIQFELFDVDGCQLKLRRQMSMEREAFLTFLITGYA